MRSAAIQATAIAGAWVLPATWTGSDASRAVATGPTVAPD